MSNNKKSEIKAVTSPLVFAKKDFATWLEGIKSGIPKYVHFGTDWTVKLPKDIAEPDIKKGIFFYENCTYSYSQSYVGKGKTPTVIIKKLINGIPFKVDLQLLISNNRTEEKPVATICIVFKLHNGKLSNEVFLEGDITRFIDKRMFGADLKNSKYFVSRGNHRFNNSKGQGYSYTLDLTSHDVVPYLQVWASSYDDLAKSIS